MKMSLPYSFLRVFENEVPRFLQFVFKCLSVCLERERERETEKTEKVRQGGREREGKEKKGGR